MPGNENAIASFTQLLSSWGIPMTGNMRSLVNRAASGDWNIERFRGLLQKTPEYRKAFPGIFNKNGTMKMSETQYRNAQRQIEGYASSLGISINRKQMEYLFRHDVTPNEFKDRGTALSRLRRNPELYAAFRQELIQGKVAKPGEVTQKHLFNYIMGEGDHKWYELWQDAVTRNAATSAGLAITKAQEDYKKLSQGVIERISNLGLSEGDIMKGFGQIEEQLRNTLPLTEARQYGLSKQDIVLATFGGKGSSEARQRLEQVLQASQAFDEGRTVTTQVSPDDEEGLRTVGGERRRPQF